MIKTTFLVIGTHVDV